MSAVAPSPTRRLAGVAIAMLVGVAVFELVVHLAGASTARGAAAAAFIIAVSVSVAFVKPRRRALKGR